MKTGLGKEYETLWEKIYKGQITTEKECETNYQDDYLRGMANAQSIIFMICL